MYLSSHLFFAGVAVVSIEPVVIPLLAALLAKRDNLKYAEGALDPCVSVVDGAPNHLQICAAGRVKNISVKTVIRNTVRSTTHGASY